MKERTALLQTWPSIWLNLCRYHLRKSWSIHKNKVVSPTSGMRSHMSDWQQGVQGDWHGRKESSGATISRSRRQVSEVARPCKVLNRYSLLKASTTTEVQTAIADEVSFLKRLAKSQKSLASACHAAINRHLRPFLEIYWCRNNLWQSWSNYGHS
jgi:hypothetical protein